MLTNLQLYQNFLQVRKNIFKNVNAKKNKKIILKTHLGLGDQISSMKIVENLIEEEVEIIWPIKTNNYSFFKETIGHWPNLNLIKYNPEEITFKNLIEKINNKDKYRIMQFSQNSLAAVKNIFPKYCLNSHFNILFGYHPTDLISKKFRNSLITNSQIEPPSQLYAFIDHHPGTDREIPVEIFNLIKNRGLKIVHNDINIPLSKLVLILDNAQELHLVNSAPLCLALTINSRAQSKFHYDNRKEPLSYSYDNWVSIDLNPNLVTNIYRKSKLIEYYQAQIEKLLFAFEKES